MGRGPLPPHLAQWPGQVRPARLPLAEQTQHEYPGVGRRRRDRLKQPHRRHVRPVQVIDDQEQPALAGGGAQRGDHVVEEVETAAALAAGRVQQQGTRLTQLAQDLYPRPVRRRALALQTGAPRGPHARVSRSPYQRVGQGRLAGARLTLHEHQTPTAQAGRRKPALNVGEFAAPSDKEVVIHGPTVAPICARQCEYHDEWFPGRHPARSRPSVRGWHHPPPPDSAACAWAASSPSSAPPRSAQSVTPFVPLAVYIDRYRYPFTLTVHVLVEPSWECSPC